MENTTIEKYLYKIKGLRGQKELIQLQQHHFFGYKPITGLLQAV